MNDSQGRRNFLKTLGGLSAAGLGLAAVKPGSVNAAQENILSENRFGVLVDTTVCIGCRRCEWACKKSHGLPAGSIEEYDDRNVYDHRRRPNPSGYTVVNLYKDGESAKSTTLKVQCMHCDQPACVSACIVGAFNKKENGAVVWDESKCIGCRYCMIACPFQIPTFDYHKAIAPEIRKCDFCYERLTQGKLPSCVDICPVESLTFGERSELLKLARQRISDNPDKYKNHIFGEKEVGGTSWLYISNIDFAALDFPALGDSPAPGVSESIQHGIFAYFVPPLALYALLGGIMYMTKKTNIKDEE